MLRPTLIFLLISLSSWAKNLERYEMALEKYYYEQLDQRLGKLVPSGNYFIEVDAKVNPSNIKESSKREIELPLGGKIEMESEASDQETLWPSKHLQSLTIDVVVGEVDQEALSSIQNRLQQSIHIDTLPSATLNVSAPDADINSTWSMGKGEVQQWIERKLATKLSESEIIALFVAAIAILLFLLSQILARLSLGKVIKESKRVASDLTQALMSMGGSSRVESKRDQVHEDQLDKDDLDQIGANTYHQMFYDTVSVEGYRHVAYQLLYGVDLDNTIQDQLAQTIEPSLQEYAKHFSRPESEVGLKTILLTNLSAYRQLLDQDLAKTLSGYQVETLHQIVQSLKPELQALTLTVLGPIRKKAFIQGLSTEHKLELLPLASTVLERKSFETLKLDLQKSIAKIRPDLSLLTVERPFEDLRFDLLEMHTFAEEEAFYQAAKTHGLEHIDNVLMGFDHFSFEDWAKFQVKTLALVYFGHSDDRVAEVRENLADSKHKWFDTFVDQARIEQRDYQDPEVSAARETILAELRRFREQDQTQNQEDVA